MTTWPGWGPCAASTSCASSASTSATWSASASNRWTRWKRRSRNWTPSPPSSAGATTWPACPRIHGKSLRAGGGRLGRGAAKPLDDSDAADESGPDETSSLRLTRPSAPWDGPVPPRPEQMGALPEATPPRILTRNARRWTACRRVSGARRNDRKARITAPKLDDFFRPPQVDRLVQRMAAAPAGLIVVAGLEPRPPEGARRAFVPSARSAIFRVLLREILQARPDGRCIVVTEDSSHRRIPRQFNRAWSSSAWSRLILTPTRLRARAPVSRACCHRPVGRDERRRALDAGRAGALVRSQVETSLHGADGLYPCWTWAWSGTSSRGWAGS